MARLRPRYLPAATAAVLGLMLMLLAMAGSRMPLRPSAWPVATSQAAVWHWSGGIDLTEDQATTLQLGGVSDCFVWRGEVAAGASGPLCHRRGGPVLGLPEGLRRHLVIRILDGQQHLLAAPDRAARLQRLLLDELGRCPPPAGRWAGVQIDWDVPTSQLGRYAGFLRALRSQLPADQLLSCTALPTWAGAGLEGIAGSVDAVALQTYTLGLPPDPGTATALVGRPLADPSVAPALAELAASGRPFWVGLASCELALRCGPDGTVLELTPVRPEALLAGGLVLLDHRTGRERILTIGEDRAGQPSWLVAQTTWRGLRDQCRVVAGLPGRCLGPAIFRLAHPRSTAAFSCARLAAALTGQGAEAVTRPLVMDGGQWFLQADQQEDLVAVGPLLIPGQLPRGTPPAGLRWHAGLGAEPVLPGHADGTVLWIDFLRAGSRLPLDLQPLPGSPAIAGVAP